MIMSGRAKHKKYHGLLSASIVLAVIMFCVPPPPGVQAAEKAGIKDMVVSNSSDDLLLNLSVVNAFRPGVEEGIVNGIPALFTFYVTLREMKGGRPGEQIVSLEFDRTITYDSLKELYVVYFSELNSSLAVEDFSKARDLMTEVNGTRVAALDRLKTGSEYSLSVKVRLERKTLPLFFHYLIPFWKLKDYVTDWYYVEFRY